jgi:uncharacterized protein (TIGR02444 family)
MAQMISLWTFACKLYNKPTVKNTCLQLQENYGVDVPLLLASCWVVECGGVLSCKQVSILQDIATQWQTQSIQPLRALRQQMKLTIPTAYSAAWMLVREQVKTTELLAEQQLLQILESSIQQYILSSEENSLTTETLTNDEHMYIDRLVDTIFRFVPVLAESPESNTAVADIVASVVSERPQIQYDAILNSINQYSPISE